MAGLVGDEANIISESISIVLSTYGENETLRKLTAESSVHFTKFCHELVRVIRDGCKLQSCRKKALVNFHQLSISILPSLWKTLLENLEIAHLGALHCQSVNRQVLNRVLLDCGGSVSQEYASTGTAQMMSSEEESAVRYAAGYVATKMLKKYMKTDNIRDAHFVECLSHMATTGDDSSFYAYTSEWIKTVDRGGLFHVSDIAFVFFRAIELVTQACLPQHLLQSTSSAGSNKSVYTKIIEDEDVLFYWTMLSVDLPSEISTELLECIVDQWITIRGFAITSSWLEQYKQASEKKTKGSKSLRKHLKTATEYRET